MLDLDRLAALGYVLRLGGDGQAHILRRDAPGRALCGGAARGRDGTGEALVCLECVSECIGKIEAGDGGTNG